MVQATAYLAIVWIVGSIWQNVEPTHATAVFLILMTSVHLVKKWCVFKARLNVMRHIKI